MNGAIGILNDDRPALGGGAADGDGDANLVPGDARVGYRLHHHARIHVDGDDARVNSGRFDGFDRVVFAAAQRPNGNE